MRKKQNITERQYDERAAELTAWIAKAVSPFENDSSEKQAKRKERAETDKLFFFKTYLPHYFTCEFGTFQLDWAVEVDKQNYVYIIGCPREHAKSTFWSFGFPLHNVIFQTRWFNVLISDTNDLATDFVVAIKAELETNVRLLHDFGEFKSVPWTHSNFVTAGGVRVWARGYGEPIRGRKHGPHRPDYIVADDLENDRTVKSPKQTTGRIDWIKEAVLGSMAETGIFALVSNLFSPRSAISQMINEVDEEGVKRYKSSVHRALIDEGLSTARPLWPGNWSLQRLYAKIKQIGKKAFNKEFQNQTENDDAEFPSAKVKYYENLPTGLEVVSFCDPSAKSGEHNDYKAVITVGANRKTLTYYVIHAWIRHAGISQMLRACDDQVLSYGGLIGIEENMLGDFLHEALLNHAKEIGRYLPWVPVYHSTNKHGRIVGTLSYLFNQGKLQFKRLHSDQDRLIEQLTLLEDPSINDDGPDALESAVALFQGGSQGVEYKTLGKKRFQKKGMM